MLRKISTFLICTLSACFCLPVFAADAPFSEQQLAEMRLFMFNNVASQRSVRTKIDNDNGHVITSLPGAVLASPTNVHQGFSQDYVFHWVRDAGITMREIVNEYELAPSQQLTASLQNYIDFESITQQQISNPGEQTLGQPKFNIDGTVWEGKWGRPQNDGPALRALALCEMGRADMVWFKKVIPLVKTDLNYLVQEWRHTNYDLWEEVNDTDHFFTKMMQVRGLTCGADLLYFVDKPASRLYASTANMINHSLAAHWNEKLGYITETIKQLDYKGGGLDSAVILAVLYGNDLGEAGYLPEFSVLDDRVMSTVAALRDAFAREYPVNQQHPELPPLLGRYPGDKYDGGAFVHGNPWIITSAGIAEYYYSLAYVYRNLHKPVAITTRNQRLFKQLHLNVDVGTQYEYGTALFNNIITSLINEGDRYLERIKQHSNCEADYSCLHFAEQIDAKSGMPTSAKDLTWSYVSILRAMKVRAMAQTLPS